MRAFVRFSYHEQTAVEDVRKDRPDYKAAHASNCYGIDLPRFLEGRRVFDKSLAVCFIERLFKIIGHV
jgi:hypothetical protein